MNRAVMYHRANDVQRRDAKQVLDEFGHLIKWRDDGQDSLLDIGCGTGDVTIDFILPLMPIKFTRLVGADLSEQMLRFAREQFQNSKISFQNIDISVDLQNDTIRHIKPFDHITSFYCLHWVQDQRVAMKNVYDLLEPNGDCLVAFLASNPIFEIYQQMSTSVKWTEYMTNLNQYISPYQYSENPVDECEKMLHLAGFRDVRVYLKNKNFYYKEKDTLKKAVRAVNPFLERIPRHLHDEYLEDYVNTATKLLWSDMDANEENFVFSYKLIVYYAKK